MQVDWKNSLISLISAITMEEQKAILHALKANKGHKKIRTIFERITAIDGANEISFSADFTPQTLTRHYRKLIEFIRDTLQTNLNKSFPWLTSELLEATFFLDHGLPEFAFTIAFKGLQSSFNTEQFENADSYQRLLTSIITTGNASDHQHDKYHEISSKMVEFRKGRMEFEEIHFLYTSILIREIGKEKTISGRVLVDKISDLKQKVQSIPEPTCSRKANLFYHYILAYTHRALGDFKVSLAHTRRCLYLFDNNSWLTQEFEYLYSYLLLHCVNDACLTNEAWIAESILLGIATNYQNSPSKFYHAYLFASLLYGEFQDNEHSLNIANSLFENHQIDFEKKFKPNEYSLALYSILKLNFAWGKNTYFRKYLGLLNAVPKGKHKFEVIVYSRILEICFVAERKDWNDVFRLATNLRKIIDYANRRKDFPFAVEIINFFLTIGRNEGRNIKKTGQKTLQKLEAREGSFVPEKQLFSFSDWFNNHTFLD